MQQGAGKRWENKPGSFSIFQPSSWEQGMLHLGEASAAFSRPYAAAVALGLSLAPFRIQLPGFYYKHNC